MTTTIVAAAARTVPTDDATGRFGGYGGRYVPETLAPALDELAHAFERLRGDAGFVQRLDALLADYVGRPTPLLRARRLERAVGPRSPRIWLKREDLCHTGSHKLNNALGQALIAREMGRTRLIAETGAGQHGVATATAAALLGLPCRVYMGAEDVTRQRLNVVRMELLGAEVVAVDSGSRTLKDATNEAIRDWMGSYRDTHYVIGSVVGPHPYPTIVRTLQRVIGVEARAQILEREGRLPSALVACVGGGSNALGLFHAFVDDDDVAMYGVEAGGSGSGIGSHAASISRGTPGVLHGALSYLLQDADGAIAPTHSIAAGLDYPGVGPEHAHLHDTRRARYVAVSDAEALDAYRALSRLEGIIPALESAHAIAYATLLARGLSPDDVLLVCLSGRGDKDVARDDAQDAALHPGVITVPEIVVRPVGLDHRAVSRHPAAARHPAGAHRLAHTFALAAAERRAALIPFLAAGDPSADAFVERAVAAARAGADVLELGLPYADSLADGPTIQRAYARALASGIDTDDVLACAARVAASVATPIVLMTSYNPVRARGVAGFVRAAADAGIAGLLVPDLPHEDAAELRDAATDAGLAVPLLVGPDTSDARAVRIARAATGFVYVVRRRGVTGAGGGDDTTRRRIDTLRAAGSPPTALGFGIATPEDAARAGAHADAVIVGSALIDIAERARTRGPGDDVAAVEQAVGAFANALREARTQPDTARENSR